MYFDQVSSGKKYRYIIIDDEANITIYKKEDDELEKINNLFMHEEDKEWLTSKKYFF